LWEELGSIWKSGENLEYYKLRLMDISCWSSEDQNIDKNVDSKGYAYAVSDGNDSIGNLPSGYSCYILAKSLSTFYPYHEMLCKTESLKALD
jgi:hypothetical protein